MDTESFLLSFNRFVSRRGMPVTMCSDRATNFVAGAQDLAWYGVFSHRLVTRELERKGITWHFNPPASPDYGGVWERLVRSCKVALDVTLGSRDVTDEVFSTVIAEVEALLNSRPLTHISVDPHDPVPLTPNHFLIPFYESQEPLADPPVDQVVSKHTFVHQQVIMKHFWRRWVKEYTPLLTERRKYHRQTPNLQVNDIVLIADVNSRKVAYRASSRSQFK